MVTFNTQRLRLKSCNIVRTRAGVKSAFGQKIASVLLFTGKEHEEETELDYFGARYYDADLALWISPDRARQFYNPYLYAGNGYNPINGVDPDGNSIEGALRTVFNTPEVDVRSQRIEGVSPAQHRANAEQSLGRASAVTAPLPPVALFFLAQQQAVSIDRLNRGEKSTASFSVDTGLTILGAGIGFLKGLVTEASLGIKTLLYGTDLAEGAVSEQLGNGAGEVFPVEKVEE